MSDATGATAFLESMRSGRVVQETVTTVEPEANENIDQNGHIVEQPVGEVTEQPAAETTERPAAEAAQE